MKKRILALLISGVLAVSIAGCGDKKESHESGTKKPSKIETAVKPVEKTDEKPVINQNTSTPEVNSLVTKPETKPSTNPPTTNPEVKPNPNPPIEKPIEKPKEETTLSSNQVFEKIMAGIETVKQVEVDTDQFNEQYSIDPSILDNYLVMSPMMIVHSSECAVFKVKDTKDIEKVKVGINKRLKYLENIWEQYLPSQYELVQNNKIVIKNKYVLFVIDENADKIVNNFNTLVK